MNRYYLFILLLSFPILSSSQISFRVMWYNVENLFDTYDNPETQDDEFTPTGTRYWTKKKYYHKLQQIAKVINTAGEWETPALIGLCEVENDSVLIHLLNRTPLKQQHYRYCVAETEDSRGIRNALLYQRDKFRLINYSSICVTSGRPKERKTRHLLHVWGEIATGDTLDVFLAHFPSRYGGEKESENRRIHAATILKTITDSLLNTRRSPQILIMGDFNDTPRNKSLEKIISAKPLFQSRNNVNTEIETDQLYNIIPLSTHKAVTGTHKYQGEWSQLDHLIINGSMLIPEKPFRLVKNSVRIFMPEFLLTEDKTGGGIRPKRTYHGFKYEGGYSDHLPIIADFLLYLHN